ncbi:MAG: hypothetical protein AAGC55_26780, partial [Myxococcota bacterium]
ATLLLGGREYRPREDGGIVVPFSTRPGLATVLLCHGRLTERATFDHKAERYALSAGFFVAREQLLADGRAVVAIRPLLAIHGVRMPLGLIDEPTLVIEARDHRGVVTRAEAALTLSDDEVATHEFAVPRGLGHISFTLRGKVRSVSAQRDIDVTAVSRISLNQIDRGEHTEDVHLEASAAGYVLRVLGKGGEVRADRPVNLELWHRDLTRPLAITLQSDEDGRITLGALPEIIRVAATLPGGNVRRWSFGRQRCTVPGAVHGLAGQIVELPISAEPDPRRRISLLEVHDDGTCVRDVSERATVADGTLRLDGLEPGDYSLAVLPDGAHTDVRITRGALRDTWLTGRRRILGAGPALAPRIAAVAVTESELAVTVTGASPSTRVHLLATRFAGEYDVAGALGRSHIAEPGWVAMGEVRSQYISGRDIGDEYRYVLERRHADKFAGNLLDRPSALLSPWAVRSTSTGSERLADGSAYGSADLAKKRASMAGAARP